MKYVLRRRPRSLIRGSDLGYVPLIYCLQNEEGELFPIIGSPPAGVDVEDQTHLEEI